MRTTRPWIQIQIGCFFFKDPSSIDPFSESWTQFKVPAQVLYYAPSVKNFELFQLLDIDRVTSVANLNINGVISFTIS